MIFFIFVDVFRCFLQSYCYLWFMTFAFWFFFFAFWFFFFLLWLSGLWVYWSCLFSRWCRRLFCVVWRWNRQVPVSWLLCHADGDSSLFLCSVFCCYSAVLFSSSLSFAAFSASMALICSRVRLYSSLSFWTLRFISSMSDEPFFEAALRNPRLFS